jgi:hypothetical protein
MLDARSSMLDVEALSKLDRSMLDPIEDRPQLRSWLGAPPLQSPSSHRPRPRYDPSVLGAPPRILQ